MFENIREDFRQGYRHNHKGVSPRRAFFASFFHLGTQAVMTYRFGRWTRQLPVPVVRQILYAFYLVAKYFVELLHGVVISSGADIAPGFVVHTVHGVFIPPTRIGRRCYVQHGVVVAYGCEEIGDDVYFGAGAKVVRPVRIGNRVKIGANAVVVGDLPDDCTAVGIPARPVGAGRPSVPDHLPTSLEAPGD
jgi:serine O-acetyltransferase